jgi:hypothetical protein
MIILFGHVLRKQDRLRLAYEHDWLAWADKATATSTFPTFEEWLTTRTEQAEKAKKEAGHVRS